MWVFSGLIPKTPYASGFCSLEINKHQEIQTPLNLKLSGYVAHCTCGKLFKRSSHNVKNKKCRLLAEIWKTNTLITTLFRHVLAPDCHFRGLFLVVTSLNMDFKPAWIVFDKREIP